MKSLKNIMRRCFSLVLILVMVAVALPYTGETVWAATVSGSLTDTSLGLSASGDDITWNVSGNSISVSKSSSESGGCNQNTTYYNSTLTIKNTNTTSTNILVSFNYSVTMNGGKVTIGDTELIGSVSNKSFSTELQPGASFDIYFETGSTDKDTSISITDITVTKRETATFTPADHGSYTVDGTAINSSTSFVKDSGYSYSVVATPAEGYGFDGWINAATGATLSTSATAALPVTEATTITAKFSCRHTRTEIRDKADADCTNDGYTGDTYCTTCGEQLSTGSVIPKLGHDYQETVITNPTCTETGEKQWICSRCNDVEKSEEIPAKGHTSATDAAVAATCTTTGLTEGSHCSVCGEILTAQTTVDALGHDWIAGEVTEATCTEEGVQPYTCSRCDETKSEAIDPTGHTETVDEAVEPTCTTTGLKAGSHCSVCNAVIVAQESIPALGHNYDEGVVTTEPTCTTTGVRTFTCSRCGDTYTNEIAALGHTSVTDPAVAPTCTETGLTEGSHCSVCEDIIAAQEEVAALGHDYVDHICTRCGDVQLHGWVTDENGTTYYVDGVQPYAGTWATIDEKDYYFDDAHYIKKGLTEIDGVLYVLDSADGHFCKELNGEFATADALYLVTEGIAVPACTVTWNNEDGTKLASEVVAVGSVPTYQGAIPTKAATDTAKYSFCGWSPAVAAVTADTAFTAQFKEEQNTYTISLYIRVGDQEVKKSTTTAYAVNKSKAITAPATCKDSEGNVYSFDHWEFDGVTYSTSLKMTVKPSTGGDHKAVAVYAAEVTVPQPTLVIADKYAETVDGKAKIGLTASWSVPEGYTVTGVSFLVSKTVQDPDFGVSGVSTATSSIKTATGTYTVHVNMDKYRTTDLYVKAYLKYTDPNGTAGTLTTPVAVCNWTALAS